MSSNRPIILKYGLPNMGKPMNYHHLRSFIIGDAYRRLLVAQHINVISDLHCNDIGENMGSLIYYTNHINTKAQFKTIEDIYSAYEFMRELSNSNLDIQNDISQEICKIQTNYKYMYEIRNVIETIYINYIVKFINSIDVYIDNLSKESDYLNEAEKIINKLLKKEIMIKKNDFEISMKEIKNILSTPLMIRHNNGRYLFTGIYFIAVYLLNKKLNPINIVFIISGKLNTQISQVIDAAQILRIRSNIKHLILSDIHIEDSSIIRNPDLLLKTITTSDCDLKFYDAENKRKFMVDVFKLENYWKEPNKRIFISPSKMYKTRGYKVLKDFAHFRKLYTNLIKSEYISNELNRALRISTDEYSLVPLMNLLRTKMASLRECADVSVSINTVVQIMEILGLGKWEVILTNHSEFFDETI